MLISSTQVLATIKGVAVTEIPQDLFIPPDALEVLLESFTGPLDLLLYLIRHQNIDIFDIPIAHITNQYMKYIQWIEEKRLELAAEYLLMAAMLAEIKSKLLLPARTNDEEGEEDPRMELVRKLQAYEQMKLAAQFLDELPRCERDLYRVWFNPVQVKTAIVLPDVELKELTKIMLHLIAQQGHRLHHQIVLEPLSVRERMAMVLQRLQQEKTLLFHQLFSSKEGQRGLTVSFIAILELARQSLLQINQISLFTSIYLTMPNHE